ncbi:MAG: NAD-dependent epimerase/dehydratase family protein [Chitinophagales bacterium]|nr:NAD-dependent epimerase/dehydratase family protein [Chitinophagales bacterium]MBP9188668.1 NAD-dependent epimerase/dehydratase family protein [Chitinophagales bacterium]MBP9548541.1 NAD-dependent epimerase/dehydratase family protein [Chitinophagales bacterium]MBP9705561.1 NAD-dependent epimerase/dehydratase family protein [Chitinophagales bacterium]
MQNKILLIGACGQIGSELTAYLRNKKGNENIIAADIKEPPAAIADGPFEILNVLDKQALADLIKKHEITEIYNLAAMLSATGEKYPLKAWDLNMNGLLNTLELAKELPIKKIFWPSSIAVFGPSTPVTNTPQLTVMEPQTIYGISKLAGERLCEWYFLKHGIDVRSIRYPGLISYKAEPGGGTTDYAVDIYFQAKRKGSYDCFLEKDTILPMMYMPDALRATVDLMETDAEQIKVRSSYNVAAMSFSPEMISESIKKQLPDFTITYTPDFRQQIAVTWPQSIDDSIARNHWNWKPEYDLDAMTKDMLANIR